MNDSQIAKIAKLETNVDHIKEGIDEIKLNTKDLVSTQRNLNERIIKLQEHSNNHHSQIKDMSEKILEVEKSLDSISKKQVFTAGAAAGAGAVAGVVAPSAGAKLFAFLKVFGL